MIIRTMMIAAMDKSTGIDTEENPETTETAEEVDTGEAVAEDRGAGNNEETTAEDVAVVIAIKQIYIEIIEVAL
jgi:hypothetical protein